MSQSENGSEFETLFDNWLALEGACRTDVEMILDFLDKDDNNQALRRAFSRASWGFIEAITFGLNDLVNFGNSHEPENYLSIDPTKGGTKRIKNVLIESCKLLCPGWFPDFSGEEWVKFRCSYAKRNSLMHPKNLQDFSMSDTDLNTAKDAICWMLETTNEIKKRAIVRADIPL